MAEEEKEKNQQPGGGDEVKKEPAQAPATPASVPPPEEKKKKKIRLMSREEIEKALAHARATMGGESSVYVKQLLTRQAELGGGTSAAAKKE